MNKPQMHEARQIAGDTWMLPASLPVPGAGLLSVNAYLIDGREPILIDTGMLGLRDEFMRALRSVIAPEELRWIWITHADPDHVGNLMPILAEAPQARVVTSFLGFGKLGLLGHEIPNVHLLNPGQILNAGGRQLVAVAPPAFDAPETAGAFDPETQFFFSADCFGALLHEPVESAMDIAPDSLREGLVTWSTVDSPWLHRIDPKAFDQSLAAVRDLNPTAILSGHLPPAFGMTDTLLQHLAATPNAQPFVGPDQEAFEQMMAGMLTETS